MGLQVIFTFIFLLSFLFEGGGGGRVIFVCQGMWGWSQAPKRVTGAMWGRGNRV